MFMGEYTHSIDAKGRVIVPAKFREALGNEFIVTKGLDGCLFVFPHDTWTEFEAKLKAKRDVAVKRQKKEINFWKEIDEREEEVYQHILKNRNARNAEQKTEPVQTKILHQEESVPAENVVEQERENVTNSFYGQNQ